MIPETAAQGFERGAGTYARARPAYPVAAVDDLCVAVGAGAGDHVVELGAGTGIFTRQLLRRGLDVTAVEPVAAMRDRLGELLDASRISAGTAEATGLPADCAQAVFAATAWHWFAPDRAISEVRRLLRPGSGGLGLAWNEYDTSVPWVAELDAISLRRRPPDAPSGSSGTWREYFGDLPGWLPLRTAAYANPWPSNREGIINRIMSSSVIAALPATGQAAARDEAQAVMDRHGLDARATIDLPYVTRIYWTRPGH